MQPQENKAPQEMQGKEIASKPKGRLTYWLAGGLVAVVVAGFGITSIVGWVLTHPPRLPVDVTPLSKGLEYQEITFNSRQDKLKLKGWLIPADNSKKTVILAHGYSKNRLQKDVPALDVAADIVKLGFNVVMFDFRNAGESEGEITSVGQYEVLDLLGAIDYVKNQPQLREKIVLHGFSMGASTAIMAGAREPEVAAVIADAPFSSLKPYLMENLRVWTHLPEIPFNQTFLLIMPTLTGLEPEKVSPLEEVKNLRGRPLLLIHGDSDTKIPLQHSLNIKEVYPEAELIKINGADHVKAYATNRELYIKKVREFLKRL